MATRAKIKTKCAVCGRESEQSVLMSTNAIGSMDLDTRPPEMQRSVLIYEIQECPHCHYCNRTISDIIPSFKNEALSSPSFKKFLEDDTVRDIPKRFILAGFLNAVSGNDMTAGILYLNAAWMFDDYSEIVNAEKSRKKAAFYIKKVVENDSKPETVIMLSDILRRAGEFDEAGKVLNTLTEVKEDILKKIISFENILIKEQDRDCYRVEEATNK